MKKEVMKKWVKALRSGKYKQGRGGLQTSKDKFCCLGVLCSIAPKHIQVMKTKSGKIKGAELTAQPCVLEWAGIKTEEGIYCSDGDLVTHNDTLYDDFNKIADIIEKYWEEL